MSKHRGVMLVYVCDKSNNSDRLTSHAGLVLRADFGLVLVLVDMFYVCFFFLNQEYHFHTVPNSTYALATNRLR